MYVEEDAYLCLQKQQRKPIKNVGEKNYFILNSSDALINDFWYLLINSY